MSIIEFGGQGNDYFQELITIYHKYEWIQEFLHTMDHWLSQDSKTSKKTIQLKAWLQQKYPLPEEWQSIFSYPLIFVTQVCNYLIFLKCKETSHETMLQTVCCTLGHSQGIVTSILLAISKTTQEIQENAIPFVRYMYSHGVHVQNCVEFSKELDNTPMLSIRRVSYEIVQTMIDEFHQHVGAPVVQLGLINGNESCCVSGTMQALKQFQKVLDSKCVSVKEDQSRVPFHQRKTVCSVSYLNVSSPFHSFLLHQAQQGIEQDLQNLNLSVVSSQLLLPVLSTNTPIQNLKEMDDGLDLMPLIVKMQLTETANWVEMWKYTVKHNWLSGDILDFGPDKGAAVLTSTLIEGSGVPVVVATDKYFEKIGPAPLVHSPLYGLSEYLHSSIPDQLSWETQYTPKVVCSDDGYTLENQFTRTIGKPPIVIGGMTPTTSLNGVPLVGAITNAGYYGEIAGGGLSRPHIFENCIRQLMKVNKPGYGIWINVLYLNSKQWSFQFPMICQMRQKGYPIQGITIAAGVPSFEKACEILQQLNQVGVEYVGFKPGSKQAIYNVLEIAQAFPLMKIMIQYTAGRSGGHHSFESFAPLYSTYGAIRRVPNIVLVVGSGFGDHEDSIEFLTGTWNTTYFNQKGLVFPMPCDGILFASRVMVAKEAATSTKVKELLVKTTGLSVEEEHRWVESYDKPVGGIISVISELGEPIHKVANRGVLCWKHFDDKYFSLPRNQMVEAILRDKHDIINRLNKDYQKVYFGEISQMTYAEILLRCIELMYVAKQNRWIHETYFSRVVQLWHYFEQRFCDRSESRPSVLDEAQLKSNPTTTIKRMIAKNYSSMETCIISALDVNFFLNLCKTGGKPVNFIPILDQDFAFYFKKDSLWYSEDLEAVPDQDPQRVVILQGPLAVRYSTVVDLPIATILNTTNDGYIQHLVENALIKHVNTEKSPTTIIEAGAMEWDEWKLQLLTLSGEIDWWNCLISSPIVVEGTYYAKSPFTQLLKPRANQVVKRCTEQRIELYEKEQLKVEFLHNGVDNIVEVLIHEDKHVLRLKFGYISKQHLLHADQQSNIREIQALYAYEWNIGKQEQHLSVATIFTDTIILDQQQVDLYNAAIGYGCKEIRYDFATVISWRPLIQGLFSKEVECNLLDLVHLNHSYRVLTTVKQVFEVNDTIDVKCQVISLRNLLDKGKLVSVKATLARNELELMEINSEFLIQGQFNDYHNCFSLENDIIEIQFKSLKEVKLFQSMQWFSPMNGLSQTLSQEDKLKVHLKSKSKYNSNGIVNEIEVSGKVYQQRDDVATLDCIGSIKEKIHSSSENKEAINYIAKCLMNEFSHPETEDNAVSFASGGYNMCEVPIEIIIPADANEKYAIGSKDMNPIHRSHYITALTKQLPEGKPILHGMYTATKVRHLILSHFDANDADIVSYSVNFDGIVYHNDKLFLQLRHVGMNSGRKVIQFQVAHGVTGERKISGKFELKQKSMAFVFTGQGSAEVGMGMDMYETSMVAKRIWDHGDLHLRNTFGFSILEIVRKNPKSLTIHFGGKKGKLIRQNYLNIQCEDPKTGKKQPLIPEITKTTQQFTFSAPQGLLFATQFSQPALVLLEQATFMEMKASGLVPNQTLFAGHSLGEYAGLSAFAQVLVIEDVAEIVFLRGLVMQKSVVRDIDGRSNYGMVAANPTRVGPHFDEAMLFTLVERISQLSNELIQVVNFNVQGRQYVVAGTLRNLEVLSLSMTKAKNEVGVELSYNVIQDIINQVSHVVPTKLTRGSATIPLVGIDVPFHSKELLNGVPAFRNLLKTKFQPHILEQRCDQLVNCYIPNLIAKPFETSSEYIKEVYDLTGSALLKDILEDYQNQATQTIIYTLVIELLAYQFASPVQWIQTQEYLFYQIKVESFIEIGPVPTLTNMALRTKSNKPFQCRILNYLKDMGQLQFQEELESTFPSASEYALSFRSDDNVVEVEMEEELEAVEEQDIPKSPPLEIVSPVNSVLPSVSDEPVSMEFVLKSYLALSFNKAYGDITDTMTVKELSNGKSAIQNERVGELEVEFQLKNAENALAEYSIAEIVKGAPAYTKLGKVTTGLISKMYSSKMPGGFNLSKVKQYLSQRKGLGNGHIDMCLVFSLLLAPKLRLKTEKDGEAWLDDVVAQYCKLRNVIITASPSVATVVPSGAPCVSIPKIPDEAIQVDHMLRCYFAYKFNKKLAEIPVESTVKTLSNGKSALQNEIIGDLDKEFNGLSGSENSSELTITQMKQLYQPTYSTLGPFLKQLLPKLISSKLAAGYSLSKMKQYLAQERCLEAGHIDGVLVHTLLHMPKQRLSTDQHTIQWINTVVSDYAQFKNITIPKASEYQSTASHGVGNPQNAIVSTELQQSLNALFKDQIQSFSSFLNHDTYEQYQKLENEITIREENELKLDQFGSEHGEYYQSSILPKFDPRKERCYNSYWNWVIQDALDLYFQTILSTSVPRKDEAIVLNQFNRDLHFKAMSPWINSDAQDSSLENPPLNVQKPFLCNRSTPELLHITQYFVKRAQDEGNHEYSQAIQLLVEQVENWLTKHPVNLPVFQSMQPNVKITKAGKLEYYESPRENVPDPIAYVSELARNLQYEEPCFGRDASAASSIASVSPRQDVKPTIMESARGLELMNEQSSDEDSDNESVHSVCSEPCRSYSTAIKDSSISKKKTVAGPKLSALRLSLSHRHYNQQRHEGYEQPEAELDENLKQIVLPYVHLRKPSNADSTIRLYDREATCTFLQCMKDIAANGLTFYNKTALVTGVGKGSIGIEIVKALLEGGATVFITTSGALHNSFFREVYELHGSKNSELILLPMNQASKQDIRNIVHHIYYTKQRDIDFLIPFAALSENGRTVDSIIDDRSEVSHRIMLTNVLRLIGEVIQMKKQTQVVNTRPAIVLLPLSPNHGDFGGDGLYAESKLGLESLFHKWYSEDWNEFICISGAIIGWTRGTGLMNDNNMIASRVEEMGMRTFSSTEMAFNLTALLHPIMIEKAIDGPVYADLSGGMAQLSNLKEKIDTIRFELQETASIQASLFQIETISISKDEPVLHPMGNFSLYFQPSSLDSATKKLQSNAILKDMLDLTQVVVVVGFGEVSPWGNARTRWEMEASGEFSLEGCIELAWLTGYIRYDYKQGHWVDNSTNEVLLDHLIKSKYEEQILNHAGIRLIEPELFEGYDPKQKVMLQQIAIDKHMSPIEVNDYQEALEFRNELGKDNVDIFQNENDAWMVRLKKGAVLSIPRALSFNRFVAGQIPTGWNAERLGVPKDIVESVDPVTLYTIVSTVEALISAGITDPYEFYQYVHVSQVGNTSGGGMGGMRALKRIYGQRQLGKTVPSDSLQECFINTMPAWVNMLLLSSSGPIKTPVGACATAAESVEIGVETIQSGKARVVVVGGYDDFGEEGSYEFAQMKATSDSHKEIEAGRIPQEFSRPCTSTRGGFMESHGAGMQILMDAQLALEMGVPIYGIIGLTNTATDKQGRSVPAPGQGILSTARELHSNDTRNPLLDLSYRKEQFNYEIEQIQQWKAQQSHDSSEWVEEMVDRKTKAAQALWGNHFFKNRSDIAPLRGALNVWGLTIDDIDVVSFHGTGTKANDSNESEVTQKQMEHLGRSLGNPVPVICQKALTGHPKGAAAAWMLNGLLQTIQTGQIPGNRNNDCTASELRAFNLLTYPNRTLQTDGIKAALMKSFGFGQASGEILVLHPQFLLSLLSEPQLQQYQQLRCKRIIKATHYMEHVITGKHSLVQVKTKAPYTESQESAILLNPLARAQYDKHEQTWTFGGMIPKPKKKKVKTQSKPSKPVTEQHSITTALTSFSGNSSGLGIDIEPIATFENLQDRETFLSRNFTSSEMTYCFNAPSPSSSFAGKWAAKEAVIKAISSSSPNIENKWKGPGAGLSDIEIIKSKSGAPIARLHGHALSIYQELGLQSISISISHSGEYAVAQAIVS